MADDVLFTGSRARRLGLLAAAAALLITAALALQYFFAANYPAPTFERGFADIGTFFTGKPFATSGAAALGGVPVAVIALGIGVLLLLAALFHSAALARTARPVAWLNAVGALALVTYSLMALHSLGLLWLGYALAAVVAAVLLGRGSLLPSPITLAAFAVAIGALGIGVREYHGVVRRLYEAEIGVNMVAQFYRLPIVPQPSVLSPYWSVRATRNFENAPIHIVQYADPLCSDCEIMYAQLKELEKEFFGQMNVAYQFFPLEAKCNDVVEKDLHPGACDLSYMLAYDSTKFVRLHDEIYENRRAAKQPEWRAAFAKRWGVEAALTDSTVQRRIRELVATGAEYEKTSEKYAHGIRSTPTLIINGRMIIGTLPLEHLRAIFTALVDERREETGGKFLENWVDTGCSIPEPGKPAKPCSASPRR